MALNGSGPISLAGSTVGESIAIELNESATGTRSLNDTIVRDLAGVASGAIVMPTNFWGKSSVNNPLYTWGDNSVGSLGLNNTTNYSSPVQVGTTNDWSMVEFGSYDSFSIKLDGTLWALGGGNYSGSLGLGDSIGRSSPVQVGALTTWSQVSSGASVFTLAIKDNGTLWSWGYGANGQLGLNSTTSYSSPMQVGSLTNWLQVSAGNYTAGAVKTDGTIWVWGVNPYGNLGIGGTTTQSSPVQVGALTNWASVSAGRYYYLATKTDGTLWAWGAGTDGCLGTGSTTTQTSPVQIGSLTTWSKVDASFSQQPFSFATKTNNSMWVWGDNGFGQLGLNDLTNRSSPVQLGALTNWLQPSVSERSDQGFGMAVKTDGTLWSWGSNNVGQLGLGYKTNRSSPVQVGALTDWSQVSAGGYGSGAVQEK